jgi:hypothetical protein
MDGATINWEEKEWRLLMILKNYYAGGTAGTSTGKNA